MVNSVSLTLSALLGFVNTKDMNTWKVELLFPVECGVLVCAFCGAVIELFVVFRCWTLFPKSNPSL